MKTCSECGTSYPNSRVLCLNCDEILEEPQYLRLVYVTAIISFGFHFLLAKAGYKGSGLLSETLKTAVFLLILTVIAWKLFQKIRAPQRKILYELASLYSDRTGRVTVLAAIILIIFLFLGFHVPMPGHARAVTEPDPLLLFRIARYWIVLFFGAAYILTILSIQGAAFFNLSLSNALTPKERIASDTESDNQRPSDSREI